MAQEGITGLKGIREGEERKDGSWGWGRQVEGPKENTELTRGFWFPSNGGKGSQPGEW